MQRWGRMAAAGAMAWMAAALPAAAADFEPPRAAPALTPVQVGPAQTPQRIAVRRYTARPTNERVGVIASGMFCGSPKDVVFTEPLAKAVLSSYVATVRRELSAAGYPEFNESLFGPAAADAADMPEYELGASLTGVEMRLCGTANEAEGGVRLQMRWELFAPRERRVVYAATTDGSSQADASARRSMLEITQRALTVAVRNLLADPAFVEQATRKAQARPTAEQPALAVAHRSLSSQPVADRMAQLQSAVTTLYSGFGSGSGFYIDGDGWLLTNQHVVGDARFVKVKLANGRELVGEVMRSAAARDVALVKTEPVALAPFELAGTEAQAGDDVWVLGSPLGDKLAYTVTRGVLSAAREVQGLRWLQSDVRVLPGSSGGPMVGRGGAVIGIVARGLAEGSAGVNFFVPIGEAMQTLRVEFRQP